MRTQTHKKEILKGEEETLVEKFSCVLYKHSRYLPMGRKSLIPDLQVLMFNIIYSKRFYNIFREEKYRKSFTCNDI